ncbi:hypothetical protein J4402_02800 [Candidatus Pacearchaeota archaeon]|nr:hypothetical protein [Candidatus Pacearchaeota archaeon]
MNSEYVGLSRDEKIFAQKNMLKSQLDFLSSLKRLQSYRKLREEEFKLKIDLKTKIGMLMEDLRKLEKILPEVEDMESGGKEKKESLEHEIEEIRRELAKLI